MFEKKPDAAEAVDFIERQVYAFLKPMGFRKHGRTLHRFVDGDLSQVVNFQSGTLAAWNDKHDLLWVNLGIRVPECREKTFEPAQKLKKYYHEYECNLRARLGELVDGRGICYKLKLGPEKIASDIIESLKMHVIPVFEVLCSRDAILQHRREYAAFDQMSSHMILLEEAMIYGRRGELEQAAQLFREYYQKILAEYAYDLEHGVQMYLKKGHSVTYRNARTGQTETIVAEKDGYVTIYDVNRGHIEYVEDLAQRLHIGLAG